MQNGQDAAFPLPRAQYGGRPAVFLGALGPPVDASVYLVCCRGREGLMDIELSHGVWAPEMKQVLACVALAPARAHLEHKFTQPDGLRRWTTLYIDLPRGHKGVVKRGGNRLVQQELAPVRAKRGRGRAGKRRQRLLTPKALGIKIPDPKTEIARACRF